MMMTGELSNLKNAAKESPRGGLMLRRHKMLPHPIKQLDLMLNTYQSPSGCIDACCSEELVSKMAHFAQKETGAIQLPPTPPTNTRPPSENEHLTHSHINFDENSTSIPKKPPSLNTLRSRQSPPTPDFTPPRQSRSTFVSLTQNPYPSSNSFITAPEDPYVSEEDECGYAMMTLLLSTQPSESPSKLSDAEQVQDAYEQNLEEYLEEGGIRPKIWYTNSLPKTTDIVDDQSLEASHDDQSSTLEEFNLDRGFPTHRHENFRNNSAHYYVNEATETTTGAKFYLSIQPSDPILPDFWEDNSPQQLSIEKGDKVVEAEESRESDIDIANLSIYARRNASRSTYRSSTTWISTHNRLPTQAKTLRHTRKQIGLRECAEQPYQCSPAVNNTSSYISQSSQNHSIFKIPDLVDPRPTSNGDISPRLSSKYRKEIIKKGGIPVLVIPERTSCGKSQRTLSLRSTSSRKMRRSISRNTLPSPYHNVSYDYENYDLNLWKSDLFSRFPDPEYNESTNNPTSSTSIRDSAFTAQSSVYTSRPSSLTTESLRTHNQLLAMNSTPNPDASFFPPSSTKSCQTSSKSSEHLSVDFHNYPIHNHMLSGYVTPYSQSSYETAAEVSEALAVSLFPHQTRSIMVRQNRTFSGSFPQPTNLKPGSTTNSKSLDICQRKTPLATLDVPFYSESDGDLETKTELLTPNLREPSEPPVILFHPPTPRTVDKDSPSNSECVLIGPDSLSKQISLSSFPASNSYEFEEFSPFIRSISNRTQQSYHDQISSRISSEESISSGVSFMSDVVPDQSKLHPFWRPTKFWSDQEEFIEDFDHKEVPNNRRKIFPCGTLSSRLIKSIKVFPLQRSREAPSKSVENQQISLISEHSHVMRNQRIRYKKGEVKLDTEDKYWGLDFKEGNGGRKHSFAGLGLRMENKGWNELKRWAKEKKK